MSIPLSVTNPWPQQNPFNKLLYRRRINGLVQLGIYSDELALQLGKDGHFVTSRLASWLATERISEDIDLLSNDITRASSPAMWLTIPIAQAVLVSIDSMHAWRLHRQLAELTVRRRSHH